MLHRPPFRQWIVGNWKMYKTSQEAESYWNDFLPYLEASWVDVALAVPFTLIASAVSKVAESGLMIGAQNMHDAYEGAFTGEIAARMLVDVGAQFVIVGHSERRTLFGESDEWIHKKIVRALESHLHVILCVGESLEAHEANKTHEVLEAQMDKALQQLSAEELQNVTLAYEPVWAVGSGKPATAEKIQEVHLFLRHLMAKKVGAELANQLYILYGGSVQLHNAAHILAQSEVDGLLIGGASLAASTFGKIIHSAPAVQALDERRSARKDLEIFTDLNHLPPQPASIEGSVSLELSAKTDAISGQMQQQGQPS